MPKTAITRLGRKRVSSRMDPEVLPQPLGGGRVGDRKDQQRDAEQIRLLEAALRRPREPVKK